MRNLSMLYLLPSSAPADAPVPTCPGLAPSRPNDRASRGTSVLPVVGDGISGGNALARRELPVVLVISRRPIPLLRAPVRGRAEPITSVEGRGAAWEPAMSLAYRATIAFVAFVACPMLWTIALSGPSFGQARVAAAADTGQHAQASHGRHVRGTSSVPLLTSTPAIESFSTDIAPAV